MLPHTLKTLSCGSTCTDHTQSLIAGEMTLLLLTHQVRVAQVQPWTNRYIDKEGTTLNAIKAGWHAMHVCAGAGNYFAASSSYSMQYCNNHRSTASALVALSLAKAKANPISRLILPSGAAVVVAAATTGVTPANIALLHQHLGAATAATYIQFLNATVPAAQAGSNPTAATAAAALAAAAVAAAGGVSAPSMQASSMLSGAAAEMHHEWLGRCVGNVLGLLQYFAEMRGLLPPR